MTNTQLAKRQERVRKLILVLSSLFPDAGMALRYSNHWELLVAVILSSQCTDIMVNKVTDTLFQKYKTFDDYICADALEFEQDIKSTGFYKNKAKYILSSAKIIKKNFGGNIPRTLDELLTLPGVARKTANVVLGNAYGVIEGIAVDTHVRRFAIKFDITDSSDPKKIEQDLMQVVPKQYWFTITYWLIEYGRAICPARKHDCATHPLTAIYPQAGRIWPKAH